MVVEFTWDKIEQAEAQIDDSLGETPWDAKDAAILLLDLQSLFDVSLKFIDNNVVITQTSYCFVISDSIG